jgi:hypothetical protein
LIDLARVLAWALTPAARNWVTTPLLIAMAVLGFEVLRVKRRGSSPQISPSKRRDPGGPGRCFSFSALAGDAALEIMNDDPKASSRRWRRRVRLPGTVGRHATSRVCVPSRAWLARNHRSRRSSDRRDR